MAVKGSYWNFNVNCLLAGQIEQHLTLLINLSTSFTIVSIDPYIIHVLGPMSAVVRRYKIVE